MQRAVTAAWPRVAPGGWLVTLSTETTIDAECIPLPHHSPGWLTLIQYTAST
jgi:hypothetical protein